MSADVFKFKRGTTTQVNAYLPALGEPVYDTTLKQLKIGDGIAFGGVPLANTLTADKLSTPRNISLSGSVTGTVSFDGSADANITTSVGASLQATLDSKAPLASPTLTGVPAVPTAAVNTNTTQIASTAFVVGQAASSVPLIDGTATVGTSLRYARQDHVHPTDTTRAPTASPAFTGVPTAPTASPGNNSTQIATTAYADTLGALKANLASPTFTGVPAVPTAAVGTNTTQVASMAALQAEIANKRTWTSYTPTVTATTGTFTSASATGKHMTVFGICFVDISITITTKGTGTFPLASLPFTALAGSAAHLMVAREVAINGKAGNARITAGLNTVLTSDYNALDLITGDGCVISITGWYPVA